MWSCSENHIITLDYVSGKIHIQGDEKKEITVFESKIKIKHIENWISIGICPLCHMWGDLVWVCDLGHFTTIDENTREMRLFNYTDKYGSVYSLEDLDQHIKDIKAKLDADMCPICLGVDQFLPSPPYYL